MISAQSAAEQKKSRGTQEIANYLPSMSSEIGRKRILQEGYHIRGQRNNRKITLSGSNNFSELLHSYQIVMMLGTE